MGTLATVIGIGCLVLGLIGFIAYLIDAFTQDRIARAMRETGITQDAAPTTDTPAHSSGRALDDLRECYRKGHLYTEWARTRTHWVCVRCGDAVKLLVDDEPFDQDAAALGDEAEQYLRRSAS